jgi:tetratricopeptide (TPR) repeat protein
MLLALLLTATLASAAPVELDAIRDHVDRGMFRTARIELAEFMAGRPDDPGALILLARCREAEGDLTGAYDAATKAADLDPSAKDCWRLSGRLSFDIGQELTSAGKSADTVNAWFADSEARFRRLQQLDPEDPEATWRIGQAREWQGQADIAEQFYDRQIMEFPRLADGYRCLGSLSLTRSKRLTNKDPAKAKQLRALAFSTFTDGLAEAGDDARLLLVFGEAMWELGEREQAIELLLRAVRADPEFSRAWNRLSEVADPVAVLLPAAIETLRTSPTAADPAMWAGFLTNKREPKPGEKPFTRHEEALGYLLPALEKHGDHEGLYTQAFLAAQVLFGSDPKNAPSPGIGTDAFTRIHQAWKWSGDAANNLGFFYREARKYDLSIEWYLRACDRDPENQDILNDTGLIFLFHFPQERQKGLPYFLKTISLVIEGDQKPIRGYWDALENLCKHYWEVDRQPGKVIEYARLRYQVTKGVKPYNLSQNAAKHAKLAKEALGQ